MGGRPGARAWRPDALAHSRGRPPGSSAAGGARPGPRGAGRLGLVRDPDPRFGRLPLDREALELGPVDRLGNGRVPALLDRHALGFAARRHAHPEEHGRAVAVRPPALGGMSPAILEVAALTGPGVVQRAQPVRGRRRRRRRHPQLPEDPVAHPKVELLGEGERRGGVREGVASRRVAGGRGAAGRLLAGLGRREVGRRREEGRALTGSAAAGGGGTGESELATPRTPARIDPATRAPAAVPARGQRRANATDRRPARRRAGPIVILSATSCPSSPHPACPGCRSLRT